MNKDFWKGKKVLVTGHTGFKGTWLFNWLKVLGADVKGLSLPDNLCTADLDPFVEGREIIFHLAAQALVAEGFKNPRATFETNVMGTVRLYEAIRRAKSAFVIVTITSDKCYENDDSYYPKRETDLLGGSDPYSASKACQEIVSKCFYDAYFEGMDISLYTARAGNVIGGGDWAENRLIPDCVRAADKGVPVVLRCPRATRPFQHVLDALHGYLLLAERGYDSPFGEFDSFNFGPIESMDVLTAANRFMLYYGGEVRVEESSFFKEKPALHLDSSKARHILGWRPLFNRHEAIETTALDYSLIKKGTFDMEEAIVSYMEQL